MPPDVVRHISGVRQGSAGQQPVLGLRVVGSVDAGAGPGVAPVALGAGPGRAGPPGAPGQGGDELVGAEFRAEEAGWLWQFELNPV
jgi:hypothetical protein